MTSSGPDPAAQEPLPRSRAELARYIPHREPFLFVDEILACDNHRTVRSALRLTGVEPCFAGHFPGRPIFPGVLLLEHMAQTAAFLVARSRAAGDAPAAAPEPALMVFAGVEQARFLAPVPPGAEIVTDVTAVKLFESMGLLEAESAVAGTPVARARLSFAALPEERAAPREGRR